MSNKNSNPQISIVLPVYNGERFLRQAIDSIIDQVFQDWELIIVNDCSTDSSRLIMEEYSEKDYRIKIVDNPENLKLPRSLNAGFNIAQGEYYTWTSDDNLLKPHMLELLFNELESNNEYGMVYSDHDDIDENGKEIGKRILGEPEDMYIKGNVCGASFLYRREVAQAVGEYDPDMFLAEDYDYWMRLFSVSKIKHISDILYSCRRHKQSLTETKKAQIALQTYRALIKNYWTMSGMLTEDDKESWFKLLYRYALAAGKQEDMDSFIKSSNKTMKDMHRSKRIQSCKDIIKKFIRGK